MTMYLVAAHGFSNEGISCSSSEVSIEPCYEGN